MTPCAEINPLLAAHAFSALDTEEQTTVDAHLAACDACFETYMRLGSLPVLLDLAGSADEAIHSPPPLLEASVLAALPAGRRRRTATARPSNRTLIGLGALGLLAVCAVLASVLLGGPRQPGPGVQVRLTASAQARGAHGTADLRVEPWGTQVDLRAAGLSPTQGTQIYEVWFISSHGRLSAGTFTVGRGATTSIRLAVAAHATSYTSLAISLEPDGLDPALRGPDLLSAPLPT